MWFCLSSAMSSERNVKQAIPIVICNKSDFSIKIISFQSRYWCQTRQHLNSVIHMMNIIIYILNYLLIFKNVFALAFSFVLSVSCGILNFVVCNLWYPVGYKQKY